MAEVENLLSKPWQKFLAKFSEIHELPVSEWKEVHMLAYICQKYEHQFGSKFAISYRGAPSKCPEIYMIKKMLAMVNTTSMRKLKLFIDWVWETKIAPNKVRFRTLGFFTTPGFANEFDAAKVAASKITKTTPIPEEYLQVAQMMELEVATYGDLAFIKMAVDQSDNSESRMPYKKLLNHLSSIGLDLNLLNNLV
jgi:hypothetical protein